MSNDHWVSEWLLTFDSRSLLANIPLRFYPPDQIVLLLSTIDILTISVMIIVSLVGPPIPAETDKPKMALSPFTFVMKLAWETVYVLCFRHLCSKMLCKPKIDSSLLASVSAIRNRPHAFHFWVWFSVCRVWSSLHVASKLIHLNLLFSRHLPQNDPSMGIGHAHKFLTPLHAFTLLWNFRVFSSKFLYYLFWSLYS